MGNSDCMFESIKKNKYSKMMWIEQNNHYSSDEQKAFKINMENIVYEINIISFCNRKHIEIKCSDSVELEKLYILVGEIRRFEYLFDGAFFVLVRCTADEENITDCIRDVELHYYLNAKSLHKIPLSLDDKNYGEYFEKWISQEKELGIINQMVLYASNLKSLPVDMRISMLAECYEALAEKLDEKKMISIKLEETEMVKKCPHCKQLVRHHFKPRRTFANCLTAVLEKYGKIVLGIEYYDIKDLVQCIVNTRNMIFHVTPKEKVLDGRQCDFYVAKLDWIYRYIVLSLMGISREKLDEVMTKQILEYEKQYPKIDLSKK